MRIFNILLCIAASALLHTAGGQVVKVEGSGNGYSGTELKVFLQSDPISRNLVPATRVQCDNEGRFTFEVKLSGNETLIIQAGIYNIFFYATPGISYEIKLPDLVPKTTEEEQDSFFIYIRIMPEVINPASDINNLLKRFDDEFNPLFNRIADRVMYNVKLNEIPSLIEKLNSLSAIEGANDFYRDFVTFRLIMLNLVARGEYPGRKEDSILINRRFVRENPAYIDLIEQIFTGYFKDLSGGKSSKAFKQAVSAPSLGDLEKVVINDGKATDSELIEFVILMNLYSAYYDGYLEPGKIMSLLDSITKEGISDFTRGLAQRISERISLLAVSTVPPDFSLYDISGKQYSLADTRGKYLLLSFARSDNSFSISEYGIVNSWLHGFSEKIQMVTILRDNDFRSGVSRMSSLGFSWLMLDGSSADMLEYMYDVKIYPSFLLIDTSGHILIRNCPFPSENLESLIKKITEKGVD